jgi:hypothetical protein
MLPIPAWSGIGQEQDFVGMTQAILRPRGLFFVADENDHVVFRFHPVDPLRYRVGRVGIVSGPLRENACPEGLPGGRCIQPGDRAVALQARHQPVDEFGAADPGGCRDQGHGAGPCPGAPLRQGRPYPLDDELGHAHRNQRVAADHLLVAGTRQADQDAVAHGDDRGSARFAGDQRHFPHRLAAAHVPEHLGLAQLVLAQDPQAPADDDIDGLPRVALAEENLATLYMHPAQVLEHELQEGLVEDAECRLQGIPEPGKLDDRLDIKMVLQCHVRAPRDWEGGR